MAKIGKGKVIIAGILFILAVISFFLLADAFINSTAYSRMVGSLTDKQNTIAEISGMMTIQDGCGK